MLTAPYRPILITMLLLCSYSLALAQTDTSHIPADTTKKKISKFDQFNKKAEALFKIIPVPLYSYTTEAGHIFGLAKYNLLHFSRKDTISKPSKLSEVFTISSNGRINASVSTEMILKENRYVIMSYVNYKKQPEYIYGIGNDISKDSIQEVEYSRFQFSATALRQWFKNFYGGVAVTVSDYFSVKPDSNSFLVKENYPGLEGGFSTGIGLSTAYDSRDNRYNPYKGAYAIGTVIWHPDFLGSVYQYTRVDIDLRKYFNPWLKHVVALQATTTFTSGDVPFYELAQMGGDSKMRGYYMGAYRDNVLVDAQVEYRAPIWNIFGAAAWVGTGRVADSYSDLSLEGFHLSYGLGFRIRVDSKNNTNLRFDMGFGPGNWQGFYINFAEAF
ncbi:BamA/TamA family outer membrane protein [Chitinophaga sp. RCC_12]|uniref:BamA/TamA family outer membrane protein n=1 Tax=Chitinophaga sp. RCC_12 TaxID=3239226 RepID=UPI0035249FF2